MSNALILLLLLHFLFSPSSIPISLANVLNVGPRIFQSTRNSKYGYTGVTGTCGYANVATAANQFLADACALVASHFAEIPNIMAPTNSAVILAKWWWDCAASISLVCDLVWLTDVVLWVLSKMVC